jgi:hypothetical protein
VDGARARDATATNGVRLAVQPDASILASRPNAEQTTYTATFETTGEGSPAAARSNARSACRAAIRPRRLRPLPVTGLAVNRAARRRPRQRRNAARHRDHAGRRRAAAFDPGPAGRRAWRRAWPARGINALRETTRLPRHAVLKAARPFGYGGTRVTLRIAQEDGSIGQGVAASGWRRPSPPIAVGATVPAASAARHANRRPSRRWRQTSPALPPVDAVVAADPRL